jgi:hypothetical protein
MRNLISILALALVAFSTPASAQTCDFSGAPVGPSQSRVTMRVRDGGTTNTHYFGGPAHAFYYVSDIYGPNADISSVTIADYDAAVNEGRTRMIDAKTAWFLWDVNRAPRGTEADPPVVAFSSREAAQEWQRELGGELVQGWDNLWGNFSGSYSTSYGEMGDRRRHIERE